MLQPMQDVIRLSSIPYIHGSIGASNSYDVLVLWVKYQVLHVQSRTLKLHFTSTTTHIPRANDCSGGISMGQAIPRRTSCRKGIEKWME